MPPTMLDMDQIDDELRHRMDAFLRHAEDELERWELLLARADRGQELIGAILGLIREFREDDDGSHR